VTVDLEISVETGRSEAVLRLSGRLTAGESQMHLRAAVDPLIDRALARVTIDLAQVSYLDSAGLGELLRARARAGEVGTALAVRSPSARVATLLRLTGVEEVLSGGRAASRPDQASADDPLASE
jgi:anti-anti-sigma factor